MRILIKWGSEIWTCYRFKWLKRGWFADGLNFQWNLKSEAQLFEIQTNSLHFVKTHLKY